MTWHRLIEHQLHNDGSLPEGRLALVSESSEASTRIPPTLLVLGDFLARDEDTPLHQRAILWLDGDTVDAALACAQLTIQTPLGPAPVGRVRDFAPAHLARRLPELSSLLQDRQWLVAAKVPMGTNPKLLSRLNAAYEDQRERARMLAQPNLDPLAILVKRALAKQRPLIDEAFVDGEIAAIDAELRRATLEISADDRLMRLSPRWRVLEELLDRARRGGVRIGVLTCSKTDLAADLEDAVHPTKSGLAQLLEREARSGRPIVALVTDLQLEPSASDMNLLSQCARVGALHNAPVLFNGAPAGEDGMLSSIRFKAYCEMSDARYGVIVGREDTLPSSAPPATLEIAARMCESFAHHGWCGRLSGDLELVEPNEDDSERTLSLPHTLLTSWVAHHLRAIADAELDWARSERDVLEAALGEWLDGFSTTEPISSPRLRERMPFFATKIEVTEVGARYRTAFELHMRSTDGPSVLRDVAWLDREAARSAD